MKEDLVDILSDSNKDINNQTLMDYVSNKLSSEESHNLEKEMIDSEFVNDAVEGLETFSNKTQLLTFVDDLNNHIQKQIEEKRRKRQKRKLKIQPWAIMAIVIILVLAILGYIIIRKYTVAN